MNLPVLASDLLAKMDAYWRAANYLAVGQIYLYDNPLLRRPLTLADIKHMLLGHWGTTPGQNFIYVHLNRIIKQYDLDMIYVSGPGHGGPALVGNTYLEGTYSEIYPDISQDEAGLQKLFRQFSFPGGIPSHVSPECPGSIHEGGGHCLMHQCRFVAFDEKGCPAVAAQQLFELITRNARQHRRIRDLVTVQMQDRQHRAVADRVEEFVGMPGGRQRAGLGFAVADHAGDDEIRIVEHCAEGMA